MQLRQNNKTLAAQGLISSLKRTALSGHFLAMLFVRGLGLFLQILLQLLMGRFFGPATLGIYQVFSSWMATLGEVAAQGQPTKSMKNLAVLGWGEDAKSEFSKSLYSILVFSGFASVGLAVIYLVVITPLWSDLFGLSESAIAKGMMFLLVPSCLAFACMRLVSESMKALGRTVLGIFLDTVVLPLIVILAIVALLVSNITPSNFQLICIATTSIVAVAVFSVALIFSGFHRSASRTRRKTCVLNRVPASETRAFWGTGVLSILFLSSPFILMPFYAPMDEVGYFSVAFKLINLISTILILLAGLYGPRFARAFHDGDSKKLGRGLKETQIISLALYLPFIALLFLFSTPVLTIFGQEFANPDSMSFLLILSVGQLINAATGLPSILLNMSGAAVHELRITLVCLIGFVLLTLILGPRYGGVGVALAFTVGMIIKNCAAYIAALILLKTQNTSGLNPSLPNTKTEYV